MRSPRPHQLHEQQRLIASLRNPMLYPHPARLIHVVETHSAWVLLAGHHAYKIKKAVDLGFLDFTDLQARKFYCEEELRLNRRYAVGLYEDVLPIGGTVTRPMLGRKPAIEYAIKMHRFDSAKQLDRLLEHNQAPPSLFDALADTVARFHQYLSPAAEDSEFGSLEAIRAPMLQNFVQLREQMHPGVLDLDGLRQLSENEFAAAVPILTQRKQQGHILECHGDLHLGNIALIHGEPVPFDGLEFNAAFRWIDTINEVAFLVMDLLYRNRADLGFRFLNRYLENTGDYAGIRVLRFYLAYRAVVRAKVAAIRAHQYPMRAGGASEAVAECRLYLALAELCLTRRRPALILMHGLPGSGKTTVAQHALERLQAIRIRSDVERKRIFGLEALDASDGQALYTQEATQRTYDHLLALAGQGLEAGFPVIVDAAFLREAERSAFRTLAAQRQVPFAILSVEAGDATLRDRILQRQASADDASEADVDVLEILRNAQQPLTPIESAWVVRFLNEGEVARETQAWQALQRLTGGGVSGFGVHPVL